ncbi:MAG: hypothetical protein H0X45_00075 [Planctomycetes bacterium]|nr:hypothetical protein [Planctomycetota bacterium]
MSHVDVDGHRWARGRHDDPLLVVTWGELPAVTLGLRIDTAVLAIDHSILTDRYRRTRSDELTITLGWIPLDGGSGGDAPWMAVGVGARFVGNLYGDAIQGRWHRVIDANAYKLTYDNDQVDAVGYACGALPWFPTNNYGPVKARAAVGELLPRLHGVERLVFVRRDAARVDQAHEAAGTTESQTRRCCWAWSPRAIISWKRAHWRGSSRPASRVPVGRFRERRCRSRSIACAPNGIACVKKRRAIRRWHASRSRRSARRPRSSRRRRRLAHDHRRHRRDRPS